MLTSGTGPKRESAAAADGPATTIVSEVSTARANPHRFIAIVVLRVGSSCPVVLAAAPGNVRLRQRSRTTDIPRRQFGVSRAVEVVLGQRTTTAARQRPCPRALSSRAVA